MYPSGAFAHTPYAITLSMKSKEKKKKIKVSSPRMRESQTPCSSSQPSASVATDQPLAQPPKKPDPISRRDSANNEVRYYEEGEVMIVGEDHGDLIEVSSRDLDPPMAIIEVRRFDPKGDYFMSQLLGTQFWGSFFSTQAMCNKRLSILHKNYF